MAASYYRHWLHSRGCFWRQKPSIVHPSPPNSCGLLYDKAADTKGVGEDISP